MKKSLVRTSAALMITIASTTAGLSAIASPASADSTPGRQLAGTAADPQEVSPTSIYDCLGGVICLWEHKDFNGALGMYPQNPVGQCYTMGVLNNRVTSIANNTYRTVRFYDRGDCTGNYVSLGYSDYNRNLEWSIFNDKISSFKWV